MNKVVFLVKNGIGFGHIRRALLIAQALRDTTNLTPIVISQAKSLDLLRTARVRVVNFPLLHRAPSAVTEDCYLELLDELLGQLAPSVVVEDTYPDPRYGALPALRDIPLLLVMRRLDGLSLDQLRQRRAFARYTEILVAQDEHDFAREDHSGDSLAAAQASNRVSFVGNIHCALGADDIRTARERFAATGRPLVVVNGGAGGDQLPDGYGDRLFGACATVAQQLAAEGHPARFVFVTGPYYAGRPLADTSNVTVRRFQPDLPALLAAADVAVIKPGNNALSEALLGHANLVLVPDASFMERTAEHAKRMVADYGGAVVQPDADALNSAIRHALAHPPRQRGSQPNPAAVHAVAKAIQHHATADLPQVAPKQLAVVVIDRSGTRPWLGSLDSTWVLDGDPPDGTSPQDLVDRGKRAVLHIGDQLSASSERWLRLAPTRPSLLVIHAHRIQPPGGRLSPVAHRITRLLDTRVQSAVALDLRTLELAEAHALADQVHGWLANQPVQLVSFDRLHAIEADRLLGIDP